MDAVRAKQALSAGARHRPGFGPAVELASAILDEQAGWPVGQAVVLADEPETGSVRTGEAPAFVRRPVKLDPVAVRHGVARLTTVVSTWSTGHVSAAPTADLSCIAGALTDDDIAAAPRSLDAAVERVAARCPDVPSPVVALIIRSAFAPFLEEAARRALCGALTPGNTSCPACGSTPALSLIADEGEATGGSRTLWCAACRTSWSFERVRCARCGTRDPDALSFVADVGDPGRRLHVCGACGGSMKTVFARDIGHEMVAEAEDVLTAPLDALPAGETLWRADNG
jgi:FdhE protein